MKAVIEKLMQDLDGLKTTAANYRIWIKECRATKNEYGVEQYSQGLREVRPLIPQYKKAIKVLKTQQ